MLLFDVRCQTNRVVFFPPVCVHRAAFNLMIRGFPPNSNEFVFLGHKFKKLEQID